MRVPAALLLVWCGLAVSAIAAEADLTCPPLPDGATCTRFHYHIELYRPDARTRTIVSATSGFPSLDACEQARDERVRRNLVVVDHFKLLKIEPYEPDRVGPCHCDRTYDSASDSYLTPEQRVAQVRTADDVRQRVSEQLLSAVERQAEVRPAEARAADAGPAPAFDPAGVFISYETERIQSVLAASSAISDERVKARIFEACMQRIQLLSNLRRLIEIASPTSPLAVAAGEARQEAERIELITRLFGPNVAAAWAPRDARDVIVGPSPPVDADPDLVLRDTTAKFTPQQKRHALYAILARTQPDDQKQRWLLSVSESFLN